MSLELTTVVGKGGVTAKQRFDQVGAHADRLRQITRELSLPDLGTPPDVNAGKIIFTLSDTEIDNGFVIEVFAEGLADVGPFTAVQYDFDFPPGVNFISGLGGAIIDGPGWSSFALGTDGHAKEGLFSAYASRQVAAEAPSSGKVLIGSGTFTGPFEAAPLVDIKRVKVSYGAERFPIANTDRVTPGD